MKNLIKNYLKDKAKPMYCKFNAEILRDFGIVSKLSHDQCLVKTRF